MVFRVAPTIMPGATPEAPDVRALPILEVTAAATASVAMEIIPAKRSPRVKETQRVLTGWKLVPKGATRPQGPPPTSMQSCTMIMKAAVEMATGVGPAPMSDMAPPVGVSLTEKEG